MLAREKRNSIQMIFALQSNKLGSISLTVWYFKTGLSTEHFQNPITVLNSQHLADVWGGDEEAEAWRWGEMP